VIKGESSILRGNFKVLSFGPRVCREDLKNFVQNFQKQIADLDSLRKNTQNNKKKKSVELEFGGGRYR